MKHYIKKILATIGLYHPALGVKISSEAKACIILKNKTTNIKIFVETGTETGWMIDRVGDQFEKVCSIELDGTLHQKAIEHFQGKEYIKLLHGDSAVEIKKVLSELDEPALFWLDAHMSGAINATNSPIMNELDAIFAHFIKNHIILIDDARHFDRQTILLIRKLAKINGYRFMIKDGIFRLYGE